MNGLFVCVQIREFLNRQDTLVSDIKGSITTTAAAVAHTPNRPAGSRKLGSLGEGAWRYGDSIPLPGF